MFMVQLLVKFKFFIQELWERKSYKYCMNVDDGRIMRSWRSCLFITFSQQALLKSEHLPIM
jgi:hypothetical protein